MDIDNTTYIAPVPKQTAKRSQPPVAAPVKKTKAKAIVPLQAPVQKPSFDITSLPSDKLSQYYQLYQQMQNAMTPNNDMMSTMFDQMNQQVNQ